MEILKIKSNAKTLSRDGSKEYYIIQTDKGKFSCWDDEIADKLKVGKSYEVIIDSNGKYKTIRGFKGEASPINAAVEAKTIKPDQAFRSDTSRETSMYTSYAKDIFLELVKGVEAPNVKEAMKTAVEAVKQAREAFEA